MSEEVTQPQADVVMDEPREDQGGKYEALFGEEVVSDDDLMGVADEEEPAASEPSDEPEEESKEEPEEEPEEPKEEPKEPDYSKPPPKGFVPIPALHEERKKNQTLQSEIAKLQGEIESLKSETALSSEFKDFKELSDKEFNDLIEEDPFEAVKYDRKLRRFQEHQAATKRAQEQKEKIEKHHADIASAVYEEMLQEVPALRDKGSKEVQSLIDFAVENGMDESMLAVLTHPGTKILPPGENVAIPIANGALGLLKLINNTRKKSDLQGLEDSIRAKLEKEVTEKVMGKLKQTDDSYRSLDSAPGASGAPSKTGKMLTESEVARLSPEEHERYLMGEL